MCPRAASLLAPSKHMLERALQQALSSPKQARHTHRIFGWRTLLVCTLRPQGITQADHCLSHGGAASVAHAHRGACTSKQVHCTDRQTVLISCFSKRLLVQQHITPGPTALRSGHAWSRPALLGAPGASCPVLMSLSYPSCSSSSARSTCRNPQLIQGCRRLGPCWVWTACAVHTAGIPAAATVCKQLVSTCAAWVWPLVCPARFDTNLHCLGSMIRTTHFVCTKKCARETAMPTANVCGAVFACRPTVGAVLPQYGTTRVSLLDLRSQSLATCIRQHHDRRNPDRS